MSGHKRLFALAAAAMMTFACSAQEPAGTGDATVLLPVPDDPTVSFLVWFKVGSQDDPVGKEGLARLTGALLAEGSTTERSYEKILDALYPMAASYDVRVDKEMTTLSGRTHKDNLEEYFALFTDAYLKPAFTEADFERLKTDQLNYLQNVLRYASDEELGKAALTSFVFEGTRYAHPPEGTVAGLESITLEDVESFYRQHFTRENAVVALGGGYPGDLVDRFEGTLDQLPEGAAGDADPAAAAEGAAEAGGTPAIQPPAIEGRQVLLVDKPGADASISFGYPIDLNRGEREFYALWLANSWLGEHRNQSSHLYQVIREARGLNYGDYSYIEAFPEGGFRNVPPPNVARDHQMFEVWIRTLPNEHAVFALRASLREIDLLVEEGLTEEELELTRSFLSKYVLHYAETTQERLGYAVDDRFYGIEGEGHLARFREVLPTLTLEEVNAAVKKHLQTANLKIAMVTGEAESIAETLGTDAASAITYESAKPEAVLSEDAVISTVELGIDPAEIRIVPVDEMFED